MSLDQNIGPFRGGMGWGWGDDKRGIKFVDEVICQLQYGEYVGEKAQ